MLRLFAPFLPFVTDEVWRWWHPTSIHAATWPAAGSAARVDDADVILDTVGDVLGRVRRAKTEAKLSQRAGVERLVVRGPASALAAIAAAEADLRDVGSVAAIELVETAEGSELTCEIDLAPVAPVG